MAVPLWCVAPVWVSARQGTTTIWDGVFTEDQANRGQRAYTGSCARCHSDDLLGVEDAPALAGPAFATRWGGVTADDMVQVIRRAMPQEAPGSLGAQQYVDIVSYILKANGSPAGTVEMPVDSERLKQIRITARTN
jgi:mono/diheme cytochrome c family protein